MKKYRKKMGHRFKSTAYRQSSTTVLSELEPEELSLSRVLALQHLPCCVCNPYSVEKEEENNSR